MIHTTMDYVAPEVELIAFEVQATLVTSIVYGDPGGAGSGSGYGDLGGY